MKYPRLIPATKLTLVAVLAAGALAVSVGSPLVFLAIIWGAGP